MPSSSASRTSSGWAGISIRAFERDEVNLAGAEAQRGPRRVDERVVVAPGLEQVLGSGWQRGGFFGVA